MCTFPFSLSRFSLSQKMDDEHASSSTSRKKRGRPKKSTPEKKEVARLRAQRFRTQKNARLHYLERLYARGCTENRSPTHLKKIRQEIRALRQKIKLFTISPWKTPDQKVQFLGFRTPSSAATPQPLDDDPSPPVQRVSMHCYIRRNEMYTMLYFNF
jgi:hypothetical protein